MAGVELQVVSHSPQSCASEPVKPFLDKVIVSASLHVYVNQTDKGELVIGTEIDPYQSYRLIRDAADLLMLSPGVVFVTVKCDIFFHAGLLSSSKNLFHRQPTPTVGVALSYLHPKRSGGCRHLVVVLATKLREASRFGLESTT